MLSSLLLAVACQCGAAAPRATIGAIAQTSEAVYLQLERGAPIVKVDKAGGERVDVSPPIARAVSAVDVDGTTIYFGTKTTQLTQGTFFPVYDGEQENFVAAVDASGALHTIAANLRDVIAVAHDTTNLYWAEPFVIWRQPLSGGPPEQFAAFSTTFINSIAVGADAVWVRTGSGLLRLDKRNGIGPALSSFFSPSPVVRDSHGDLYDGFFRYEDRGVTSLLRLPLKNFGQYSAQDTPMIASAGWVIYDEEERYDPHASASRRIAENLCDPASATVVYSASFMAGPGSAPPPTPLPMAIDSCGIFVGAERMFCFSQNLAIDGVEIFRGGLAASAVLRPEGGDVVVIHGRGFDATTTVDIDGKNAPVLLVSDSGLSVTSPPIDGIRATTSVPLRVRKGGDCTADLVAVSGLRRKAAAH